MSKPTRNQIDATTAIVDWYFQTHRRHSLEPGMPAMYADPGQIGHFAVDLDGLRAGRAAQLFRVLVTTAMFQRLRDVFVKSILRGIPATLADTLTNELRLRQLAEQLPCGVHPSAAALRVQCDLTKDPVSRRGSCTPANPGECPLHRHTETLNRYGHFGKMPMSIALAIRDSGATDTADLHAIATAGRTRGEASRWLVGSLTRSWRVSHKIASMFLSLVSNPDVLPGAPWARGVQWTDFVVVDSNVDLFLASIDYEGSRTYQARAQFIRQLAVEIDLEEYDSSVRSYNPRLVQQALYLFMSRSNRAELPMDCSKVRSNCERCPGPLRRHCPEYIEARVDSSALS